MNFLVQWGINPWGEDTLIHAQWGLVYVAFGVWRRLHAGATRSS